MSEKGLKYLAIICDFNCSTAFLPQPWLDNKHTVFGRCTKGMEAVQRISNVKVNPKTDKPYEDISIINITIKWSYVCIMSCTVMFFLPEWVIKECFECDCSKNDLLVAMKIKTFNHSEQKPKLKKTLPAGEIRSISLFYSITLWITYKSHYQVHW